MLSTIKIKKTVCVCLALVTVLLTLASCGYAEKTKRIEPTELESKVVATLGDYEILYDELVYVATECRALRESTYGKGIWDDPTLAAKYAPELEEMVITAVTSPYAILSLCQEYGYKNALEKTEIIKQVDQHVYEIIISILDDQGAKFEVETNSNGLTTGKLNLTDEQIGKAYAQYEVMLRKYGMTDRVVRIYLGADFAREELRYILCEKEKKVPYSDDDIWEFMNSDDFIHVNHIFISCKSPKEFEEKYELALSVRDGIRGGTPLDNYIRNGTDNDFGRVSTDGYYFTYSEMDEAYEKAAFALEEGEVSDVVRTDAGYYIIQRLEKDTEFMNLHIASYSDQIVYAKVKSFIDAHHAELKKSFKFNEYGMTLDLVRLCLEDKDIEYSDLLETETGEE